MRVSRCEHLIRTRNTHEEHEPGPTDTPPSRVWLDSGRKREGFPVNALCLHALVEPQVCHADTEPGNQTRGSGEAGEPSKDGTRTTPERHIGKERKARADPDSNVGQPRTRCATEDLRGTA